MYCDNTYRVWFGTRCSAVDEVRTDQYMNTIRTYYIRRLGIVTWPRTSKEPFFSSFQPVPLQYGIAQSPPVPSAGGSGGSFPAYCFMNAENSDILLLWRTAFCLLYIQTQPVLLLLLQISDIKQLQFNEWKKKKEFDLIGQTESHKHSLEISGVSCAWADLRVLALHSIKARDSNFEFLNEKTKKTRAQFGIPTCDVLSSTLSWSRDTKDILYRQEFTLDLLSCRLY